MSIGNAINKLPIGLKLLLPVMMALIVALSASAWLTASKSGAIAKDLALEAGKQQADGIGSDVEKTFAAAFGTLDTLRGSFIELRKQGITDRQAYVNMLKAALEDNPSFFGTWTGWEPNAFDGKDAEFANAGGVNDGTGRFVPYVVRSGNSISFEPLKDYDKAGAGDYYQLAFKSGEPQLLEPYSYDAAGQTVIMTSLVLPIIIDGKTVGVIGLDMSLDQMAAQLRAIKPYGTGSVSLISNTGLWAAYAKTEQIGKPVTDQDPNFNQDLPDIAAGKLHTRQAFSISLNTDVIRVFQPIQSDARKSPWSLMVNLPLDKIMAPVTELTYYTVGAAGGAVLLLALVIFLLTRMLVAKPIGSLTGAVSKLAEGNTAIEVPATKRGDELGVMARAVEFFRQKLIEIEELRQKQKQAEIEAAQARRKGMLELADSFEASVKGVVQSVSSAATELQASSQSMASIAEETTRQSAAVAAATQQASASVTTVATASEELSASIGEISRQVSDSSTVARSAVDEVSRTGQTVETLAQAAEKIGGIVQLINEIASQTNLLALNATIEAARAGDAGKGFAVVASEVKNLATQTAKATEEISAQIGSMQTVTKDAVGAMQKIRSTIDRVNEIASAIASAVEEQSAATKEISGNATQASQGTDEVTRNITGVSQAAADAGHAASQVLSASSDLSRQSETLRHEVDSFIQRVREG
ncbi:methyl-accepting chemotaxis protein [Hypericibacter sp.]|uniref:methyl-accepting chemotaxis protein n=1 Tax=Hypericibacter sp. TaxID=2705401 RepID=UPI003D6D9ADD